MGQPFTKPCWSQHARANIRAILDGGDATHLVFANRALINGWSSSRVSRARPDPLN